MTFTTILQKFWKILTGYVSYAMIILGNLLMFVLIASGLPLIQLASLITWVTIIDIATIALTWYYRKKPILSKNKQYI